VIRDKTVLAIIPARGGSKGVPRKNVRQLAGKPLIAWTIDVARRSRYIDRLVLSSEDRQIMEIARSYGCEIPFVRPPELSQDDTPGMDPVRHAVNILPDYDYVVVLQPTSPFRIQEDIDNCVELCDSAGVDTCVSTVPLTKPLQWMYTMQNGDFLEPLVGEVPTEQRRQDLHLPLVLNGAVYVARWDWIKSGHSFLQGRVMGYEMPAARSIDIDSEWDWYLASRIAEDPEFANEKANAK
jgi:CMP-N,N'-diacetyllegionaminic acid synthase